MKRRANYNVQTLEDQVLVDATEAVQGINQLKSGIASLKAQIDSFSKNNGLSNFNKQAKQSTGILNALQKTFNFSAIYLGAKQALNTLKDMTNASVDFTETANLFSVSFGENIKGLNQYYEQALDFQERLEEKLGVNIEESMRYQALFNSMTKSMGLGANYAYTLSENMTKLGYDLASLYNIDPESAMTKLRAGLAGQTEPLRELGLDITEQSLKPVAESLGVTESIRNMSQAEKAVLRYIAVMRQAQIAQGDFARTMESPANQLRIFNAQVTAFKRNMGNLWQGILGGILPYVNAVMMVINELLKMVAKLFGFEVSSQPINVSASIGADDLASDLGTAGKKAKELKAQLMGFDEINNINLDNDTSSGSGSSGGGIGGIDQRLLDALTGYDNMMDSISNKATELRDKMLEWLGFERDDDGTWKLKEGLTNFEKILDVAKTIGVAIGTWKISSTITNLLKNLGILKGKQNFQLAFGITLLATGIFAQYKGTKHLLNGDIDLFTLLETFLGTASGALGIVSILKATKKGKKLSLGNKLKFGFGIMLGIQGVQVFLDGINEGDIKKTLLGAFEGVTSLTVAFNGLFNKSLLTSIKNTTGSVATFGISTVSYFKNARASGLNLGKSLIQTGKDASNLIPTSVKVTAGIAGLATSCITAYSSMKEFKEGSISTGEAVAKTGTSIAGAAASGAILGSVIPGIGTALGALIGAIGATITSLIGLSGATDDYTYDTEELRKEVDSLSESYKNTKKSIEDNATANEAELTYAENLKTKLGEMIDANGKVKDGYQERAKIVLGELSNALGKEYTMTDNNIYINGELVKSYSDIEKSIDETIKAKRREIELEATRDLLTEAIKQEAKAKQEVAKAQENLNEKIAKYNENPWNIIDANAVNQAKSTLEEAQNALSEASDDVQLYNKDFTDKIVATTGEFSAQMIKQGQISKETLQNLATENAQNFLTELNKIDEGNQSLYLSMATTSDNLSPELIQKWKELGEKSEGEYLGSLSPLPSDVQATILSSITTINNMNDGMKMAWINLATQSKDEYNRALSSLPESTQILIETITNTTGKLTPAQVQKWADLARNDKSAYENNLTGLDETTRQRVQSCVDAINNKQWTAEEASKGLADAVERGVNTLDTTDAGKQAVNGVAEGINKNKNNWNLMSAISGLATGVVSALKNKLGIHSPSTVLRDLVGRFIPLGVAKGIDMETDSVYSSIEKLNKGIKVRASDFSIDTTQFVDYGKISGNIATKSEVLMNNDITNKIASACYSAFVTAMRTQGLKTEIEVKPDKDRLFKFVQTSAEEYEMQTGQPAFEF